jgi:hypothetical protein
MTGTVVDILNVVTVELPPPMVNGIKAHSAGWVLDTDKDKCVNFYTWKLSDIGCESDVIPSEESDEPDVILDHLSSPVFIEKGQIPRHIPSLVDLVLSKIKEAERNAIDYVNGKKTEKQHLECFGAKA